MGLQTDNRGPFSRLTLQYSNWVGPIFSSGFSVAAKLAPYEIGAIFATFRFSASSKVVLDQEEKLRKVWEQKIFDQHQIKDALSIQNCDKRNWRKGSDGVYFERNLGFLIFFHPLFA